MTDERKEQLLDEVLGESFDKEDVPQYPGRIYYQGGSFTAGFPKYPTIAVQVRFRRAYTTDDGDFQVYEARWIDTSNPENTFGEWVPSR